MAFPDDWPKDCPPVDAEDAAGTVFRIVAHNPPTDDDLKSYQELGILVGPECQRHGVSTYNTIEGALRKQKLYPRFGQHIAEGALVASLGKLSLLRNRKTQHLTWWPSTTANRKAAFKVVFTIESEHEASS